MNKFLKLAALVSCMSCLRIEEAIKLTEPHKPLPFSCPIGAHFLIKARAGRLKDRKRKILANFRDSTKLMQGYLDKLLSGDVNNELPSMIPIIGLLGLSTFSEALVSFKADNASKFKEIITRASMYQNNINKKECNLDILRENILKIEEQLRKKTTLSEVQKYEDIGNNIHNIDNVLNSLEEIIEQRIEKTRLGCEILEGYSKDTQSTKSEK